MDQIQKELNLLPENFKKIAFLIMLLTVLFISLSIFKVIEIDNRLVKKIAGSTFLLSLLILSITRNKIEDELTLKIRVKAYAASFIYGVSVTIVFPLINLILKGSFESKKGVHELLISMFIFYFIMIFLMKKNR
ncbi:hypothetical protein [Wenyingzhuangia sp. 2_MG-2023]|uniref:hypothetical protein n=1 Tax=Wenyingzhuangia sp. 2_MG-2023 TaxID=3062639 RepID=UPI0026E3B9AD|nr:hypothetical protein [Wenyingzhuangia sp. 2_MG-2023]MDO6739415.1 hypothetical protein [Wenyingzhuangia sp. 2_MG-2023]